MAGIVPLPGKRLQQGPTVYEVHPRGASCLECERDHARRSKRAPVRTSATRRVVPSQGFSIPAASDVPRLTQDKEPRRPWSGLPSISTGSASPAQNQPPAATQRPALQCPHQASAGQQRTEQPWAAPRCLWSRRTPVTGSAAPPPTILPARRRPRRQDQYISHVDSANRAMNGRRTKMGASLANECAALPLSHADGGWS